MPYKTNKDLPMQVSNLPEKAKTLFREAFNAAIEKNGEEKAFRIAWGVVKNRYKKGKTKWVAKASQVIPKTYVAKSSISGGTAHIAEFIFGDIKTDLDGDAIDKNVLCTKLNGVEGDLEHANLYRREEVSDAPLFKVIDSFFDGTNLLGTVYFYEEHPQFESVWQYCLQGDFGMSLEYQGLNEIVGISGTISPRNPRSKILSARKQ
jgi:cation transport regulator ChaB